MLRISTVLIVGSIACFQGVLSQALPDCHDVSKDVDMWVYKSNYVLTTEEDDTVDVDNFESTMRLYFLGIPLPFKVYMDVSNGELSSLDRLKRISPTSLCINSTYVKYTSGLFQYKDMKMTYKKMKAKFLFWEIEGKFTYEFEPELNLMIKKNNDPLVNDCGPVKPLTLASTGPYDYIIETDDSWKSWFLKKALRSALANDDNTPMLQNFLQRIWVTLDDYYCRFSCDI